MSAHYCEKCGIRLVGDELEGLCPSCLLKLGLDEPAVTPIAHLRHELRSPLNTIIGYAELLLEESDERGLGDSLADLQRIRSEGVLLLEVVQHSLEPFDSDKAANNSELFGAEARHQLRIRLTNIMGYSEILLEDAEHSGRRDVATDLEKIHEAGSELLARIRSLSPSFRSSPGPEMEDVQATTKPAGKGQATQVREFQDRSRAPQTGYLLVVEDNQAEASMLSRRLERQGHRVAIAENGGQALKMVRQEKYDLILLDMMMPEMNGYEVLSYLKTHHEWRDIPVLMISALDEIDSVVSCIEIGADDYLTKPYNPLLLKARVSACLEKSTRLQSSLSTFSSVPQSNSAGPWGPSPDELPVPADLGDEPAYECHDCGVVHPPPRASCPKCGGNTSRSPVPFVLLGKFQFQERVGRGGMGVVYRAIDLALGRDVAIKTLPRTSARYARFLRREARAMATIVHPNLALIFGAESWQGIPLLVFEYLPGKTLAHRLRKGPLPLSEALTLASVLADVTDCIHRAGILHRDIKPSNIGYTNAGVPKLLDFGLSQIVQDTRPKVGDPTETHLDSYSKPETSLGTPVAARKRDIMGTPAYLPPEALQIRTADAYFDLWAICVVMYGALAGSNPFKGDSVDDILRSVSKGNLPDIRELRPDCPENVAFFLRQSLDPDKQQRPSSATDLRCRIGSLTDSALN